MYLIWIVSLLENQPYKYVKRFWRIFERKYNSVGVKIFSHPHITFQGAKTDNPGELKREFQKIASKIRPFEIKVKEVDHFKNNAIYLKVIKTKDLVKSYRLVNKFLKYNCSDLLNYYFPENWTPHITLAMNDLTKNNFKKAWGEFKDLKIEFSQKLHNICIAKKLPDGKIRISQRYDL